jgi:hypothetical protein
VNCGSYDFEKILNCEKIFLREDQTVFTTDDTIRDWLVMRFADE